MTAAPGKATLNPYMSEKINAMILSRFNRHRLVFWYDPAGDMRDVFESFSDPSIEKIELANNELQVKFRVLRQEPDRKFLVYAPFERPDAAHNWLLDLEMANVVFSADEVSLIIEELGVNIGLHHYIKERLGFFKNRAERLTPLMRLAKPEWTERDLLRAMLSVAAGRDRQERELPFNLDRVIIALSCSPEHEQRWQKVIEWKLDALFFRLVEEEYHITLQESEPTGIILQLFLRAHRYQTGEDRSPFMRRAFLFIIQWRQNRKEEELYAETARQIEEKLHIRDQYAAMEDSVLASCDLFPSADYLLLSKLSATLACTQCNTANVIDIVRTRENTYWYDSDTEGTLRSFYQVIASGCRLRQAIAENRNGSRYRTLSITALWQLYTSEISAVDRVFRQFLYWFQKAGSPASLSEAQNLLQASYLNDFLVPLSMRWQSFLDDRSVFDFAPRQKTFFQSKILRALQEGKRVIVIVSDALRWEAGVELAERLQSIPRLTASAEAWCAMVPTYTAHGMASLLPHDSVEIESGSAEVRIDGQIVAGIEGRSKYLAKKLAQIAQGATALAMNADEILAMTQTAIDSMFRSVRLAYLYSSRIDMAGHASDNAVAIAIEEEIQHLIATVKKISGLSRTIVYITADHGFLYSGPARDNAFMLDVPDELGENYLDQRFVLGFTPSASKGLMCSPDAPALVAKGLMKIRRKGANSNFLHGGASLQELAIPVIQVSVTKKETASPARINVLGSRDITTPSIAIKLFQEEAVGGTVLPHRIRLRFETEDGLIISNEVSCLCDSSDPEQVNRAYTVTFEFLPEARSFRNSTIYLRLYTVVEGGTLVPYDRIPFKMRQIAYDIDFF